VFDLVIFDCDGVVIDSEVISLRMLLAELRALGVNVDHGYVVRHFLGRSYPVVMQQIRRDFGVELPEGFEADYRTRLLAAFDRQLAAMPGIGRVLDRLAVPFCLATSSSPERVRRSLQIVGLDEAFAGRITTASEVAHGKPAPDLFLLSAAKSGVDPHRCLVVEDSLPGLRAARAAGMTVWHFLGGSHLRGLDLSGDVPPWADRRIESFAEFFDTAPGLAGSGKMLDVCSQG